MTTLQEWLNNKYPTAEEKEQVKEINNYSSQFKKLDGQTLNLTNYPNLEGITINGNYLNSPLTKLELNNNPKLIELYFKYNNLTSLNINNCPNLERIYCWNNQLTNLDFLNNLNEEKLTKLYIQNNNITSDLTLFSKFVNLEELWLDNNNFTGSLQPLVGLDRLNSLSINDTDIDSGLEYLPESVEELSCSAEQRKDAKVKILEKKLKKYRGILLERDKPLADCLKDLKRAKLPKLNRAKLQEQIKYLEAEKEKLIKRITTLEELTVENERLIKEQKGRIVNEYLLFTENEEQILQELIEAHKAYFQAKKQKETNVLELRRKYDKLYYKLENESFTRSVENILTNFEELYQREWDLQKQLEEKEVNSNNENLIEEAIAKSKQALIDFTEQEKQVKENNLLIGQFGKVGLFIQFNQQSENNQEANFWLSELINIQKQLIQSPNSQSLTLELEQIKERLELNEVKQEDLNKLCQLQKEINELKDEPQAQIIQPTNLPKNN